MKVKQRILTVALAVLIMPVALVLQGCPTQSTLAGLASILGNAAASVASIEGNSSLAAKLQTDTAAAVTAITNWKSGTPATEAIEAINIVEDDLSLFPQTGPYIPLIDLALGTAESIIQILDPTGATASSAHATYKKVHLPNPPKTASQFKQQWNDMAKRNPSTTAAVIK